MDSEIDWQLIREHTQRREQPSWGQVPCSYRLLAAVKMEQMARPVGNGKENGKAMMADCAPKELSLGQSVVHAWECQPDQFDVYQSILVHSCMLLDTTSGGGNGPETGQLLIDENGLALA